MSAYVCPVCGACWASAATGRLVRQHRLAVVEDGIARGRIAVPRAPGRVCGDCQREPPRHRDLGAWWV